MFALLHDPGAGSSKSDMEDPLSDTFCLVWFRKLTNSLLSYMSNTFLSAIVLPVGLLLAVTNTEKTSKVIFLQELIQSSPKNWPMEAPCKKRSSNDDCTFGGWGSSALPDLFSFQLRERFRWRRRRRIYLGQRINQV